MKVSVICPIFNEEKYIEKCVQSVIDSDFPKDEMELLLIDGGSVDRTKEIIQNFSNKYNWIKFLNNPERIVPCALNIGIKQAQGEYIIRIDAHANYPVDYFSVLIRKIEEYNCENVGGVVITLPVDPSAKSTAIALALSSSFGMGNSYFRIGAAEDRQVDTVPFGCFRREIFEKIGYFDEELVRNQDDEFNGRIIKNGGKIYLVPTLAISYMARSTFSKVWSMFFQYGLFKPLVCKKLGRPATLRQLVPPAFAGGLIAGALLAPWHWILTCAYAGGVGLYVLIALFVSLSLAIQQKRLSIFPYLFSCFFVIHLGYGLGYWLGIFKILFKRSFNVKCNH